MPERQQRIKIPQSTFFAADYGLIYRASGIFYYKVTDTFRSTVSFLNYWKIRQDIDVGIIGSLRDMNGRLVNRQELSFDDCSVINFRPTPPQVPFEGSIEIEIFANQNLKVPFAALMGIYEAPDSVSMVHSYARAYSNIEWEEGRTITSGRESCWSVRDSDTVRSVAIMHNGAGTQPAQQATLKVQRADEKDFMSATIDIPELAPYASFKIYPSDFLPGLAEFLGPEHGNAQLSFELCRSFTRMLIGNERLDGSEFQITHSNFNYQAHESDHAEKEASAYMPFPNAGLSQRQVIVYPDIESGAYLLREANGAAHEFEGGTRLQLEAEPGNVEFTRKDGALPSRVPTGFAGQGHPDQLAFECSLGVLHNKRPSKRMWWGTVGPEADYTSKLIAVELRDVYGEMPKDVPITVKIYSSQKPDCLEAQLTCDDLENLNVGIPILELFPEAPKFLDGDFGYYSCSSDYGGLFLFSSLEHPNGCVSIEHGF